MYRLFLQTIVEKETGETKNSLIQFAGRSTELLENGVVDGAVGERIRTRGSSGDDWEISHLYCWVIVGVSIQDFYATNDTQTKWE